MVSRLVLPYLDPDRHFKRSSQALKPGGSMLISLHGIGYYTSGLKRSLRSGEKWRVLHMSFGLASGLVYLLSGKKPYIYSRQGWKADAWHSRHDLCRRAKRFGLIPISTKWERGDRIPRLVLIKKA